MKELTPRNTVEYLDRYIIGQNKAKRAVAVALRNRIRRRKLEAEIAKEISPKNILMVGPTGVGKTEIARRLATLVHAPFVKVEATKFTEVGYVGRDVESIIRDLVEISVSMVKQQRIEEVQSAAADRAEIRIIGALLPKAEKRQIPDIMKVISQNEENEKYEEKSNNELHDYPAAREKILVMLREGKMEDREIEVEVSESSMRGFSMMGGGGMDIVGINLTEALEGMFPKRSRTRRMKISEARRVLQAEEAEKLIDMEAITALALEKAQEEGIVFIDEIDKIVASKGSYGADVSREGVQRDLLPVVEGATIQTKYGNVKTDHILFIAAGAFSVVKPSDLVPELQGRFPIRVELEALTCDDLIRILREPENSLIRQYTALIGAEGCELAFTDEAVKELAYIAEKMNAEMENIGARRLHTMMELLLEEISFSTPESNVTKVEINENFVKEKLNQFIENRDLRRYLL
ncbi:MAG: ATP-dependent protease ATPase subunit HslU [Synergistaceae bacterium]|nr:ATP-dependent protease ATPase subunit HslU [Synergistaceae bacterium]